VSPGPPPLRPFGLVLHRDGRWTHEGVPVLNRRLRRAFDRSVRYLPEEGKYVVQLGRFRGQVEVEEAGFFVRSFDAAEGRIDLSDGSHERLDTASLRLSPHGRALLCRVKRDLAPGGLPARFTHAAQAELLHAVELEDDRPVLRIAGALHPLPPGL
jgi:hypothetical protein